jgi:hypothetical protein
MIHQVSPKVITLRMIVEHVYSNRKRGCGSIACSIFLAAARWGAISLTDQELKNYPEHDMESEYGKTEHIDLVRSPRPFGPPNIIQRRTDDRIDARYEQEQQCEPGEFKAGKALIAYFSAPAGTIVVVITTSSPGPIAIIVIIITFSAAALRPIFVFALLVLLARSPAEGPILILFIGNVDSRVASIAPDLPASQAAFDFQFLAAFGACEPDHVVPFKRFRP